MIAAALHPADPANWVSWSIHPSTLLGIGALGALYWWRSRLGSRQSDATTSTQRACFFAGLVVLFASLNGPIHDLSDYFLFSAHMVQHLLLTMVVTPLLLAGTPAWMLRPLFASRVIGPLARRLTRPAACFLIFNVTLVLWHLPPLYNLAMASHAVHIVQHLCFLGASTFLWWPFLGPLVEQRPPYAARMLYGVLLMFPMSIIGMYLTYADRILYPAYEGAPRIWGITPLEDQLIGGLIMWIPGNLLLIGLLSVVFFRWVAAHEADDAARSAAGDASEIAASAGHS